MGSQAVSRVFPHKPRDYPMTGDFLRNLGLERPMAALSIRGDTGFLLIAVMGPGREHCDSGRGRPRRVRTALPCFLDNALKLQSLYCNFLPKTAILRLPYLCSSQKTTPFHLTQRSLYTSRSEECFWEPNRFLPVWCRRVSARQPLTF